METKNYSTQLIDCYWMLSIVAILWKAKYLIKTLMLRTANVAVTVVFVLEEKQWMKSYAKNSDWS